MSDADALSKVEIRPMTAADEPVVDRLWQLYWHDLSESRGSLPNEHGLFKQGHLAMFREHPDDWRGYLLTFAGAPAGFAFIGLRWLATKRTIGEFFVVRAVRRHGVGGHLARTLIAQHPGPWEIAFQDNNPGAPQFWTGVVRALVGDSWTEEWRGVPNKPHIAPDHWLMFDMPAG